MLDRTLAKATTSSHWQTTATRPPTCAGAAPYLSFYLAITMGAWQHLLDTGQDRRKKYFPIDRSAHDTFPQALLHRPFYSTPKPAYCKLRTKARKRNTLSVLQQPTTLLNTHPQHHRPTARIYGAPGCCARYRLAGAPPADASHEGTLLAERSATASAARARFWPPPLAAPAPENMALAQ